MPGKGGVNMDREVTEKFTGKELDAEAGFYYFGARYYDAEIGRWISTDKAKQFSSPYAYLYYVNNVDFRGLLEIPIYIVPYLEDYSKGNITGGFLINYNDNSVTVPLKSPDKAMLVLLPYLKNSIILMQTHQDADAAKILFSDISTKIGDEEINSITFDKLSASLGEGSDIFTISCYMGINQKYMPNNIHAIDPTVINEIKPEIARQMRDEFINAVRGAKTLSELKGYKWYNDFADIYISWQLNIIFKEVFSNWDLSQSSDNTGNEGTFGVDYNKSTTTDESGLEVGNCKVSSPPK